MLVPPWRPRVMAKLIKSDTRTQKLASNKTADVVESSVPTINAQVSWVDGITSVLVTVWVESSCPLCSALIHCPFFPNPPLLPLVLKVKPVGPVFTDSEKFQLRWFAGWDAHVQGIVFSVSTDINRKVTTTTTF